VPPVSSRHRAEPLPPDDRRRAIVEAVIPLLVDRGAAVTTRQMAEAAGIAEGTIFRVFPDKCALIYEAVRVSVDPGPVQKALSGIHPEAPLETQLAEAARFLLDRFDTVITLLGVLRTLPHPEAADHIPGPPPFVAIANAAINQALARIFEMHRHQLRIEPARAASAFRGLLLANAHPAMALTERLTVDEIVGVLLTGIAEPAQEMVT
jgi:AcrR family transcriptional regulator